MVKNTTALDLIEKVEITFVKIKCHIMKFLNTENLSIVSQ